MEISNLKSGQYIRIQHGDEKVTAKVCFNKPEEKIILLFIKKFKWLGIRKYHYSDYHFTNFEKLNNLSR